MTQGWKRALYIFIFPILNANCRALKHSASRRACKSNVIRARDAASRDKCQISIHLKQGEKFWRAIPRLKLFNFEFKSPAAAKSSNIWNFNVKYTKRNCHYHLMHSIWRARVKNWQRAKDEKIPSAAARRYTLVSATHGVVSLQARPSQFKSFALQVSRSENFPTCCLAARGK